MASLRESDAEDSLNSALLGILLRRIRFSPNGKCSNKPEKKIGITDLAMALGTPANAAN